MPEHPRILKYAVIDGVERTLLEVISHAVSDNRICVFALSDGTHRYVSDIEWLAGAELFRTSTSNRGIVTSESPASESALISWAMEHSPGMGFSAYDRLFPTQATFSEDGLGNLIALPFQGMAMRQGNSVFVDKNLVPHPDQWRFLSSLAKVTEEKAREVVAEADDGPLGKLISSKDKTASTRGLSLEYRGEINASSLGAVDFPPVLEVTQANMLQVPKEGMSVRACDQMRRLAAFGNPEFYRAQAMHQYAHNKVRIIWCGEEDEERILLPRGREERLVKLVEGTGARCVLIDGRNRNDSIKAEFRGALRDSQRRAAEALLAYEYGVLSAPTGFGKTVIGAYHIGSLRLRTLVLVPRAELVTQWLGSLDQFLTIDDDRPPLLTKSGRPSKRQRSAIGRIGGGKTKVSGLVDVATFQSLTTKDELGMPVAKSLVTEYDMVICDECHHGAAPNLECVMRAVNACRVYGLSTTPKRKDGLQNIVFMQCGPIRYIVDPREQAAEQGFRRLLVPRFTRVGLPQLESGSGFKIRTKSGWHLLSSLATRTLSAKKGDTILYQIDKTAGRWLMH